MMVACSERPRRRLDHPTGGCRTTTTHVPSPPPPPHSVLAGYSSSSSDTIRRPHHHQPSVSFALTPLHSADDDVIDAYGRFSPPAHHCQRKREEMDVRKPLTLRRSAPDVIDSAEHQGTKQHHRRGNQQQCDDESKDNGRCFCCRCRLPILVALLLGLVVVCITVAASIVLFNHFPSLSSHLVQGGCVSDADCADGELCVGDPDAASSPRRCRCGKPCPVEYLPVCGSDGNTYHNVCQLKLRVCHTRTQIQVRSVGKCVALDPCADVSCSFGGRCVPSVDGESGVCRCPTDCPSVRVRPQSSVCGSDNVTYPSFCQLQRRSCTARINITVAFNGACDPCVGHECPNQQECVADEQHQAVCRCRDLQCPDHVSHRRPVCASDNVTYTSECAMRAAACPLQQRLVVVYRGECASSASNPCSRHTCRYGAVCRWDGREGEPYCVCPRCSGEYNPVCASDGHSYNNECKLRLESCETRVNLQVQYRGLCKGCEKKHCANYGVCESTERGEARCVCPRTCVPRAEPVCGIDGVTYPNECEMKVAACNKRTFITVAYHGECDLCMHVRCEYGAVCEAGRCVCPLACPEPKDSTEGAGQVCGTDGVTYGSQCRLEMEACQVATEVEGRVQLSTRHRGPCPDRDEDEGVVNSVAVTGDLTFVTGDVAGDSAGELSGDLLLCRDTRCQHGATCTVTRLDPAPQCSCLMTCRVTFSRTDPVAPICGSDLRLHRSECHMRRHACLTQLNVTPRPLVLCQRRVIDTDLSEADCLGHEPLRNESASADDDGAPISCTGGDDVTDDDLTCPVLESFCHRRGHQSAVCCRLTVVSMTTETLAPPTDADTPPPCAATANGCCPDGHTVAPRSGNLRGCPQRCKCHRLGALRPGCDPDSGRCSCRPGVSGKRCNRCSPSYWGLSKIEHDQSGCQPCACSKLGSVRPDCEQSRGRCVCKPGVTGDKCDLCINSTHKLTKNGCVKTGTGSKSSRAAVSLLKSTDQETPVSAAFTSPLERRQESRIQTRHLLADHVNNSASEGIHRTSNKHFTTPSLSGHSFLALRPMTGRQSSRVHLHLELEFISYGSSAVLMFNQPWKDDPQYFSSLTVVNGFVVFRYNVGGGPVTIQSRDQISNNRYHRVIAQRYHGDGQLTLDDGEPVIHSSSSIVDFNNDLDISQPRPIYLGSVPQLDDSLIRLTGVSSGLRGCVRRVRLSTLRDLDLTWPGSRDLLTSRGVSQCQSRRCDLRPCPGNTLCVDRHLGEYSCLCKDAGVCD